MLGAYVHREEVSGILRQFLAALVYWIVLLLGALWVTRDSSAAIGFGFLGGWTWTVFATLLQALGRARFEPPLEERSVLAIMGLQLLAAGLTALGWWLAWFNQSLSEVLAELGFFALVGAPLVLALLSGLVYAIPRFELRPDWQRNRRTEPFTSVRVPRRPLTRR